jgi:hypothetical protein
MPRTLVDLQAMSPYEFQNWACHQVQATPSQRMSGDMGVDGRVMISLDPVQVKQSQVGRPMIDAFETAIKRVGHSPDI